ncbi:site-specific integrase [Pseudomonas nitroreducens]|uniref:site-specific integrase n=1 Tax=Pseudomonas nitroreducens TaxID=46680 RepID=UPI001FE81E43|nr:site-specific integrase [Pseudomonas nitritireducens]
MAQPFKHPTSGVFYLRRRVPDELRSVLGREYKRSLKTRDPSEAKARFAAEYSKSEEAFSIARAQLAGTESLGHRDIQQLAARWFRRCLDEMERTGEFRTCLMPGTITTWESPFGPVEEQEWISLREALDTGSETDIDAEALSNARQTLKAEHIPLPAANSTTRSALVAAFRDHLLRLSDLAKQRHEGDWLAKVDLIDQQPLDIRRQGNTQTTKLLACFESYAKAKTLDDGDNRSTRKTLDEFRSTIRRFTELFGDMQVDKITRGTVQNYRAKLAEMPVKTKGAAKLTAQALIDKAKAESLPLLSTATIRNRLRALSAVLGYAVRMDWIKENPVEASGVAKAASKTAVTKGARRRKDYTATELQEIFSSPVFTHAGWQPPRQDFGKAWYWLPLLMYYTGARREELAQLAAADVMRDEAGVPYLSILATHEEAPRGPSTPTDGRTVKTEGSRRRVPLHPDLIHLGFLEYADNLPPRGQLFPHLKASPAGFYGANWGKAWAKYLREVAHISSPASPSHGFRHTLKTLSRGAGIPEDIHDAITGHSDGSVSRDYGTMPLSRIVEELAKYPSVPGLAIQAK